MNPQLFRPPPDRSEAIDLGYDLTAHFEFRTDSSCSFAIYGDCTAAVAEVVPTDLTFSKRVGWIMVCFPCDGIMPVRIQGTLPGRYAVRAMNTSISDDAAAKAELLRYDDDESRLIRMLKDICHWLFRACKVPMHLHHRALFMVGDAEVGFSSDADRQQYSWDGATNDHE